ncbi:hypothetical protein ABZ816_06660 [Actinosynnema sp. NPDC047251]|uniref:Uncharacterized protein n=1 Tax=Saccharothrix espanaensis (strain ATCC 51144 / DSM 44229 / JCM 9112 / NBRC 15066 / NRRL 15764) TaxID=1179773 RepID=K0JUD9_SACES|nr:hypothetical protein [Saccharothrix espanaensis]CCH27863.1 hypothetical protein BN6_05320 [Saccharothrix espanaensis DSM 44229]
MTDVPPEVSRTSRRTAGFGKVIGVVSALGTAAVVVFGVVEAESWWLSVVIGVCGVFAVLVVLGMVAAVGRDAEQTAALDAVGTRVRAEVVRAERVETADDVVYEIGLRIPLPDGTAFDVEHRCGHHTCAAATREAATSRPVVVDPTTRAWAVVH